MEAAETAAVAPVIPIPVLMMRGSLILHLYYHLHKKKMMMMEILKFKIIDKEDIGKPLKIIEGRVMLIAIIYLPILYTLAEINTILTYV